MNLNTTKALYINTLQKEFRSKTIYFLFALTILVIFIIQFVFGLVKDNSLQLSGFLLTSDTKLTVFFIVISVWNVLLGAIMGVGCIKSDADYNVSHQLLSLPIKRIEYLLARIVGTWSIVVAYYLASIITGTLIFSLLSDAFIFNANVFPALFISSLSMLAVITWGALFAQYTSKIVSFLITLFLAGFVSAANNVFELKEFGEMFVDLGFIKAIGIFLHFFCPRTGILNTMALHLVQDKDLIQNLFIEMGHFALSYGLLFFIVSFLFKKKDF